MKTHAAFATLTLLVVFFGTPLSARADYAAGRAAYDRGDYVAALDEWEPLAKAGDADAQYGMGLLHRKIQKELQAFIWFRKAGFQSHPKALVMLGKYHLGGWKPVANPKAKAKCLFKAAARSGFAFGQTTYAAALMRETDPYRENAPGLDFEIYYWLERAALQGDPSGQLLLSGFLLDHPIIGESVAAYVFLILAANQGNEGAIDFLAERRKEARHLHNEREDMAEAEKRATEWRPVKEERRFVPLKEFKDCLD